MNAALRDGSLSRRAFGGLLLATTTAGVAGCVGGRPPESPSPHADGTGEPSVAPRSIVASGAEGGTPSALAATAVPQHVAAVIDRYASEIPRDWGMRLPGVRSSLNTASAPDGRPRVALTFDACGGTAGSGFDQKLIGELIAQQVPAVLFLNSRWIEANSALAEQLFAEPLFEIGNHGTRHRPLSVRGRSAYGIPGTASAAEAVDEVWSNHERIRSLTGTAPRWFRPGTAHYDDVAVAIVHELGETPLGFSVNGDGGATFPARTVAREMGRATGGDIVLAHMNQPGSGTAEGTTTAIAALRDRGVQFVHID